MTTASYKNAYMLLKYESFPSQQKKWVCNSLAYSLGSVKILLVTLHKIYTHLYFPGSRRRYDIENQTFIHDMLLASSYRLPEFKLKVEPIQTSSTLKDLKHFFQVLVVFQFRMACFKSKNDAYSHCLQQIDALKCKRPRSWTALWKCNEGVYNNHYCATQDMNPCFRTSMKFETDENFVYYALKFCWCWLHRYTLLRKFCYGYRGETQYKVFLFNTM